MSVQSIHRLTGLLLIAFVAIAVSLTYWSVFAADGLLQRQDNPRYAEAAEAIRRGAIYDQNGTLLAQNIDGGRAPSGLPILIRQYPIQDALSATGFYSPQAQTGIEQAFNATLIGADRIDPVQQHVDDLLHMPPIGSDIRLTIDLPMQQAAAAAMRAYPPATGAVVALDAQSGAVRVLLSLPTFDPAVVSDPDRFKQLLADPMAPLLNRALQGIYPPGSALETVILAALLSEKTSLTQPITNADQPLALPNLTLNCAENNPGVIQTLQDAYSAACPYVFAQAAYDHRADVQHTLDAFGLLKTPSLVGFQPDQLAAPSKVRPLDTLPDDVTLLQAQGAGQGDLSVSPLQMALVAETIANHGNIFAPFLVEATRPPGGDWQSVQSNNTPIAVTSQDVADAIRGAMQQTITNGDAQPAQRAGLTIYGHAGLAFTGPEKKPIAWFVGFTDLPNGHTIAVAVALESISDPGAAAAVGGATLRAAASF